MVKENLIPKTETVYELKYEIPSYEEFLKTYKSDEKASASYESEINSQVKGWGPCQICEKPEQESYLYMSCPGINDSGVACGNPNKSYWYHSTDNAQTKITNRAQIKCSSCYVSAHMSYWLFRCSRHEGGQYYQTSKLEFKKALMLVIGAESHMGTTMSDDIITYIAHPDHRNEGRMGW